MNIKEIIVVEGKADTIAIQRAVQADTIETNGSAVTKEVIAQIQLAADRRGVIILTDPDFEGERIRRIISSKVPSCKHAFLPKQEAISKKNNDLGVENASPTSILDALAHAKYENESKGQEMDPIDLSDLHKAGLIGGPRAKKRRERLGALLHIGYANGKQLYKRLRTFRITNEEFLRAVSTVIEEEREI